MLLFDTSPTEDAPRRRKSRKPAPAAAPAPAAREEPATSYATTTAIGRVDGEVACVDDQCGAECHDIIATEKGRWLLECCFCGTGQWISALDGRLDDPVTVPVAAGEFVWPEDGSRFAGMTLGEMKPEVIAWAAKHEANETVRAACETWLAAHEPTR